MIKSIKNSSKYLLVLLLGLLVNACGTDGNKGNNIVENGSAQLVSATVVDDINASVMLQFVKTELNNQFIKNAFAYKAVKISYNTVNEDNTPVVASGLLVIPTATVAYQQERISKGKQPFSVSMLCDNHGTIFKNSDAPTNVEVADNKPNYPQAILESSYAGFAGIYPDYIGFGDSNTTLHPYIMKKASARASLDMIKASMKYMEDNGIALNHQLYITGYSEGGYVAMATAQKVEEELSNVNLMGVAPMAGPYNVEDLANRELNATHTMVYPAFLADLAYSYAHYYDVNLSEIANANITTPQFQTAFNGSYDTVAIQTILGLADSSKGDYRFYTHKASELFSTTFLNDYANNVNSAMRVRFQENALDNWTPKSKMNLIQCVDDEIIPFSESNNTYNKFKKRGTDVILTPIPTPLLSQQKDATHPFVHVNCATQAYGAAVLWFTIIRGN